MSDNTVSLTLGLVGLIGGLSAGAFGLWSARTSAQAAVKAASEAAGGVIHHGGAARNAEFQSQRRSEYAALLEALTDDKLSTEVRQRTAKALLFVREEDLKSKLDVLAKNPDAFRDNDGLSELAWAMNVDAGK